MEALGPSEMTELRSFGDCSPRAAACQGGSCGEPAGGPLMQRRRVSYASDQAQKSQKEVAHLGQENKIL